MRGSECVVRMLQGLGVDVVFGLCGDTTLPLYEALYDLDHGIRHVVTRDERSASYMADAYSRLSGKVGVCEGPSGGGATYILPGVAEANGSSVPLVCLTSDISTGDVGRGALTELDQRALFAPVTRFTAVPGHARELPRALRRAFRTATTSGLGAAHVGLPFDVQTGDVDPEDVYIDSRFNSYPAHRSAPEPKVIREAADLLARSRRPLVVAGAGVLRSAAWDELTSLSRLLGAPVATSVSGKGSIAETDPLSLGVIGSNGGLPYRHEILRESDVILYVGCRQGSVTTEKWTLPANGEKTLIQMDVEPDRIGSNYDTAVGIVADAKLGLAALGQELDERFPVVRRKKSIRRTSQSVGRLACLGSTLSPPTKSPYAPNGFCPSCCRYCQTTPWSVPIPEHLARISPPTNRLPKAGRWFVTPRAHGALGYALPAVCGAYFARPDAGRIVGVMGDGSFGLSVGELETLARLDLPVTLIVLNNANYGWIKAGQKAHGGKYYNVDFFLTEIETIDKWMTYEEHPLFRNPLYGGKPVVEAGKIEGGYKVNQVPDWAEAQIDIRLLPGQSPEGVLQEMRALFARLQKEDPELQVTVEPMTTQWVPMHYWETLTDNDPFVRAIREVAPDYVGRSPGWTGSIGGGRPDLWATGAKWINFGIEGSGENAHAPNEYASIDAAMRRARLYAALVLRMLR